MRRESLLALPMVVFLALAGCSGDSGDAGGGGGQTGGATTSGGGATTGNPGGTAPAVVFTKDESLDRLFVGPLTANNADWDRLAARATAGLAGGGNPLRMGSGAAGGYQNEVSEISGAELVPDRTVKIGNGADLMRDTDGEYVDFCTFNGQNSEVDIIIVDLPTGAEIGTYRFVNISSC